MSTQPMDREAAMILQQLEADNASMTRHARSKLDLTRVQYHRGLITYFKAVVGLPNFEDLLVEYTQSSESAARKGVSAADFLRERLRKVVPVLRAEPSLSEGTYTVSYAPRVSQPAVQCTVVAAPLKPVQVPVARAPVPLVNFTSVMSGELLTELRPRDFKEIVIPVRRYPKRVLYGPHVLTSDGPVALPEFEGGCANVSRACALHAPSAIPYVMGHNNGIPHTNLTTSKVLLDAWMWNYRAATVGRNPATREWLFALCAPTPHISVPIPAFMIHDSLADISAREFAEVGLYVADTPERDVFEAFSVLSKPLTTPQKVKMRMILWQWWAPYAIGYYMGTALACANRDQITLAPLGNQTFGQIFMSNLTSAYCTPTVCPYSVTVDGLTRIHDYTTRSPSPDPTWISACAVLSRSVAHGYTLGSGAHAATWHQLASDEPPDYVRSSSTGFTRLAGTVIHTPLVCEGRPPPSARGSVKHIFGMVPARLGREYCDRKSDKCTPAAYKLFLSTRYPGGFVFGQGRGWTVCEAYAADIASYLELSGLRTPVAVLRDEDKGDTSVFPFGLDSDPDERFTQEEAIDPGELDLHYYGSDDEEDYDVDN